ncbi:MAG: SRPBCC domain-containing protein [Acidobacteriia bacterium]|nr:SRPBCC domain-containing protein [Terriglobia bacterium]
MTPLPHRLDRTVVIAAQPETVFRFFTDSERWASWWGAGSTIDPRPGGPVRILYPGAIEVLGEVVEILSPERLVFTYGYASGKPIPPGSSRVTIRLEPDAAGTRLHLTHEFTEEAVRDQHVQGWRFQLSLFANVVANEVHAGAADLIDAWFHVWAQADEARRDEILARIAAPRVRFRDRFGTLDGAADLTAHIGASLRFMPGFRLQRKGAVRHCQGTALADWVTLTDDGKEHHSGTSVFTLTAGGQIAAVTSVSNP